MIGLGVVIVAHEFGHFIVAKSVKIRVERFALGFGPRLVGLKVGDTDYCINAIPFGGYIKMSGQEDFRPLEELRPASTTSTPGGSHPWGRGWRSSRPGSS